MKLPKLGGACVLVVALVAMAVAVPAQSTMRSNSAAPATPAVLAVTASQSLDPVTRAEVAAVARLGIPLPRAREAIVVQSAVEQEDLINKLQAALGNAFGGAWYVPAVPRLDVGVTSTAAARVAEAVAVRAGLGLDVSEIPVRSSEAELTETQRQLNRRLTGLFAREEAATWTSVEDNAVYVEVGSEAPAGERAAIEDKASEAPVKVVVTSASRPMSGDRLQARCKGFEPDKAYCDPTIVGGTTHTKAGKAWCTTGPAVRPPGKSTDTYVLTAGHCVEKVGEAFGSFNKEEKKDEEIGKALAFISPLKKENADVAAIKVENAFWKQAGDIPVIPAIAKWEAKKETEPFKVTGQTPPALKAVTCVSAHVSGSPACGTIKMLDYTSTTGVEKLVEVEGVKTLEGDSGAPWYSNKQVQGVHNGERGATGNPLYEPLEFVLERLKQVWKLELELLTEANEKR